MNKSLLSLVSALSLVFVLAFAPKAYAIDEAGNTAAPQCTDELQSSCEVCKDILCPPVAPVDPGKAAIKPPAGAPTRPPVALCDDGTTRQPPTFQKELGRVACTCLDPVGTIPVLASVGANGSIGVCVARAAAIQNALDRIAALEKTKADKAELDALRKQIEGLGGNTTTDKGLVGIVNDVLSSVEAIKGRLTAVEKDVEELKRKTVVVDFGPSIGALFRPSGDVAGVFALHFGLTAKIADSVALVAMAEGGAFKASGLPEAGWTAGGGAGVAYLFSKDVQLSLTAYGQQLGRTRDDGDGFTGNGVGYSVGPRLDLKACGNIACGGGHVLLGYGRGTVVDDDKKAQDFGGFTALIGGEFTLRTSAW